MKKIFAALLTFWIAACTAIPSPEAVPADPATPPENPPVIFEITGTPTKFVPPSMTPSITPTHSLTLAGSPTAAPTILPNTFIAPTLQSGSPVGLSSIQMIDAQIGWAIELDARIDRPDRPGSWVDPAQPEGYILRTSDGGKTWQNVTPPTGAYSPGGFFALDANTAWASDNVPCCNEITDISIWHTSDGGQTWQPSQPFSIGLYHEFYLPFRMQFIDQNTGWLLTAVEAGMSAALYYLLVHTTDGGETWTIINNTLGGCHSIGFAFINSTTGWYGANCFSQGVVYEPLETFFEAGGLELARTVDGGHTFDETTLLPTPEELQQPELAKLDSECAETRMLSISSKSIGVEWGCHIFAGAPEYRYFALSTDAGQTWNTWQPAGNEYFLNATHGWRLLAPGQLQQTTDSGLNWVALKTVAWESVQFDFISEQEGWALVTNAGVTALIHTMDGGEAWEEIKPVMASQ